MSNYNPEYRRDNKGSGSPPYSRDNSPERQAHARGRSPSGATLQLPAAKPGGLVVSPPSTSQPAYTPYYPGASPTTTSPVSTKANPPSPKSSSGAYKAYRPPVQQAYSTDSVIPSQPHGPYTAYQPPKPVTSTQLPTVAPLRVKPHPSPVISPLVQPVNNADQRPVSPPANRLPSPLPTAPRPDPVDYRPSTADSYTTLPPHDNKGGSAAAYYAPSVTDSVVSTPSTYERPGTFFEKPTTYSPPVATGPFTPQGGPYQQQPQQQAPLPSSSYGPPKPTATPPDRNRVSNYGSPAAAPITQPQSPPHLQQTNVPSATGYADSNYHPFGPPLQPQQPGSYPPAQQQGAYPPAQQQQSSYPPAQQQDAYPPAQQVGNNYPPTQKQGAYPPTQMPGAYPTTQQSSPYTPTQQATAPPVNPPQPQAYAVELPSSPGLPNHPPKPSKQLSFTLPPSDVYAERIANFMNMLEKEASLSPTAAPTLGRPEPEDLETRRHKVFRDWIVSEAKLRGPKFATDLADDLDSLSFGNKRASEQFTAKPRGGTDIYGGSSAQRPASQPAYIQPPAPPKVTMLDLSKLLPLIYPPPPAKVTAAAKLAPFQKTFAATSNLAFIERNRQTFVVNQSEMERRIQAEVDEVRRRRGKRNPADAENVVREIRKREGLDAYERFDRDVVSATYGELMKSGEVIDTVKQGVEEFVKDSVNTLTTVELLEVISFLTAVQDLSTTVHNHMESLLTERSMKYMYSLTVPLYEANDAAEAKKIEAWNQSVIAGQVADNKTAEEKRVGSYSKFIIGICDQVIAREKDKAARLTAALTELVRAVDAGTRDGGRLEFLIPHGEDTRPFDLSEEGKLLWLRSKILTAALAIQSSLDSQKALQKTKDVATRLTIKARYAAQEAEAVKQNPTNQQKNIEDINRLRESQAREIEALTKTEERESEIRGIERGRFEATIRPATDTLKSKALAVGGERAQSWAKEGNQEALLGWV
ncbi:hypothetical protein TWF225_000846 [Orbilia oligospora]|nr:hypothetical protein TWF225_000846 [Orbilia oligospora]KAF3239168.1 hypothetical protein TWF128_011869 [Orbilia oligospora]KAF3246015.1 hypothetical protein TWF217_010002 [Orbilia oligospora]KAF3274967.1 hypothetical protein TWF132_003223 [Orbilia oligospora]KAF3274968.1 hypothetical protein TWF132_003223 [Orbilia oligospora]